MGHPKRIRNILLRIDQVDGLFVMMNNDDFFFGELDDLERDYIRSLSDEFLPEISTHEQIMLNGIRERFHEYINERKSE